MYVTLAARPLPKWFHLILSVLLFNLSCAIVYVYIMTRNITSSSEKFETVPSYVVAVLFFASGCLSLSMTKSIINESLRVSQIGVAFSLFTIVVSLAAIICTLWLADVQDKLVICLYNVQNLQCICRAENVTGEDNLYIYERITGCNRLDSLNRCMIASIALDSVGAFVCFLAFSNFGLIWARKKTEGDGGGDSYGSSYGNSSSLGASSRRQRNSADSQGGSTSPSSPVGTPGSHSDWDGWLFSHPLFRQMFSEFRHSWFPPTYEQSVADASSPTDAAATPPNPATISTSSSAIEQTMITQSEFQPRRPARIRSSSPSTPPPPGGGSMFHVALGDYPPPPYSKSPKKRTSLDKERRRSGGNRGEEPIPTVHQSTRDSSSSTTRHSERITAA